MNRTRIILIVILAVILAGSIVFQMTSMLSEPTSNRLNLLEPRTELLEPGYITNNSVNVFTVILDGNGHVYSYYGNMIREGKQSNLDDGSFRNSLLEAVDKYKNELRVLLKSTEEATYSSTVYLVDEMSINKIQNYAMVDLTVFDKKVIDSVFK